MTTTIATLTDFGDRDGYTGALRGVIYSLCSSLCSGADAPRLVDISHSVPPQDVCHAAWVLGKTYPYFPSGTIFLCVVDPKVGESAQRKLLLHWKSKGWFFIGPDNGLFTPVLQAADHTLAAYALENLALTRTGKAEDISQTFHGRDVYAPAAAHLANALAENTQAENALAAFLASVGPRITDLKTLLEPEPRLDHNAGKRTLEGCVAHIDTYGNLITNIPNSWLSNNGFEQGLPAERPQEQAVEIQILSHCWQSRHLASYAAGEGEDRVFVVPGSDGTLELCLYGKSAQNHLEAAVGDGVILSIQPK